MKTKKRGPPINRKHSMNHSRPSVALAQNFLRDGNLAALLIERSGIGADDLVLDIGSGTGKITEQLAKHAGRVWAVEKDANLAAQLLEKFANTDKVKVITSDFLDVDLPTSPYKVFASIPYNTTAAIIAKLTDGPNPPVDAYLVVQEEAANRFVGTPKETLTTLLLKPWFKLNVVHRFDRKDFAPAPSVDSVLLQIQQRTRPLLSHAAQNTYRDFVTYCFINASPSLHHLLGRLLGRDALDSLMRMLPLDRSVTPTMLDFELWLCLFYQFMQHTTPHARRQVAGSRHTLKLEQSRLRKQHRTRVHQTPSNG
jgi:23S rRNA (adenine-N6)-dimethyltransferase